MRRSTIARRSAVHVATPPRRVAVGLRAVVDWLRAGYSADAPREGHCALIALAGPVSLSDSEIDRAMAESPPRADDVDIQMAITKVTDHLPTRGQVQQVRRVLVRRSEP